MRSISSKITLSEGKGKAEKKKQQGGRMEEKKAMVALLGFIFATLEIGFDKKKVFLTEEVKYIYICISKNTSQKFMNLVRHGISTTFESLPFQSRNGRPFRSKL